MRPWVALLSWLAVLSSALCCERSSADRPERHGAPASSAAAPAVVKPPAPPRAFIEGHWIAVGSLERVSLGGPAKKRSPGDEGDEGQEAMPPVHARGSVSISPRGDLSGHLELLGKNAALVGLAQLDEGPVRLRVADPPLFGTVVLLRAGERLSGELRVSLEEGADASQLSIYAGTLELSRKPAE